MVPYSCNAPSSFIQVTAAPGNELYRALLKGFPSVVPYPFRKGPAINLPYFSSVSSTEIVGSGIGSGISS